MNTFYFLRHAETLWDEAVPADRWLLSEGGRRAAEELAASGIFDLIDIIVSSGEEKAHQTALPIARRLQKGVSRCAELNDLHKGEASLSDEDFRRTLEFCFANPKESTGGWESAHHALERFCGAIERIDASHDAKKILVVSHGCVLTLYFSKMLHREEEGYSRWKRMSFCAWGIVRGCEVVKDIV